MEEHRDEQSKAQWGETAIENGFPSGVLSDVAELESYRKELNRPVYYLHKWWARRLGSVFRAAILASATPSGTSIMERFYEPIDLDGLVVYDPFMGSGTTVGEAHKLGCTALGRDINPVAYRAVRAALGPLNREEIVGAHERIKNEVAGELGAFYEGRDAEGNACEVLYYFWVKTVPCPHCTQGVDLFKSQVFASHAYPKRHPEVQVLCPSCDEIFESRYKAGEVDCPHCTHHFDQDSGPARRTKATCPGCKEDFRIAEAARGTDGGPPNHRLYAKLVLRQDGEKEYLPITEHDREKYEEAQQQLRELDSSLGEVPVPPGHNTDQVRTYGYRHWNEFFNDRQLLGLTLLGRAINDLPDGTTKDAFACLFSGVLEFNNMFASYKGEGTGAVRHMFSHHILKPERAPLEANIWGTPKSSGSFSTLYESRLLRVLDYRETPFELAPDRSHTGSGKRSVKRYGMSAPMGAKVKGFEEPVERDGSLHLSCGDSAASGLPDGSVDLVVTDPPFFDNVHYSELADFFYAWQEQLFGEGKKPESPPGQVTTRREGEVQDVAPDAFAGKLAAVFSDCYRVLTERGRLIFSYHHSREEGWSSVAQAVSQAGFAFTASQPVKSEMSNATPKSQAGSPIDIDVLLVCRKQEQDAREVKPEHEAFEKAVAASQEQIAAFNDAGRMLSGGDVRVVLGSQLLVSLSGGRSTRELTEALDNQLGRAWQMAEALAEQQVLGDQEKSAGPLFDELVEAAA